MTDEKTKNRSPGRDRAVKALPWLVLLAFLAAVQYGMGWEKVLQPWLTFHWPQLLLALGLMVLSYAVRTWRLVDYFPDEIGGRYPAALRLTLLHNLMNNLLPARTGEASFPLLMRRYFTVPYARSVSALLWFRLLDLHTILCFAIYPLLVVTPFRRLVAPVLLLWLLLPLLLYWLRNRVELYFAGRDGRLSTVMQQAMYGLPDSPLQFFKSWGLTWLNWLVKLGTLAWVLEQFVPAVSANMLIAGVIGGELTSVLPFHAPVGVGTYEAGVIAALSGVALLPTATQGAINLHLFVLGSALLGGVLGWLIPVSGTSGTEVSTAPATTGIKTDDDA
ncbi:MAG: flippase-like domain-containing protein [Thiothrix sp.]|nr:flippase-like domain-containing protein [Thiothrix sp.]